ncbi:MAG TPA: hypothetical protein VM511_13995 [Luteolibacter sp.]|nr:hypothetical protein [Luteolibacter sp.]
MQRWIVVALIGAILFGLGGGFGLWTYRQNRPQPVWVPLALNESLPPEKREELAKEIKKQLLDGSAVSDAVKETGLARKLRVSSDAEAEADARKLLFVEVGEADVPSTGAKVPSINIGFKSPRKSNKAYGEVAMRIMKDVWKMLGIKVPEGPAI